MLKGLITKFAVTIFVALLFLHPVTTMAAKQGDDEAQGAVGKCYPDGKCSKQDFAEALKRFRTAAERGNASGAYNLFAMYRDGRGVAQDYKQAYTWCELAYQYSDAPLSGRHAYQLSQECIKIKDKMSQKQVAEAKQRVSEWLESFYPARPKWDSDEYSIVNAFIASRSDSEKLFEEGKVSQGSATADLNGDGVPEIVLVWTTMGPTYWHNNLTVFAKPSGEYKPSTSLQLNGEAKLSAVKDGVIIVNQVMYAKDDPLCCPTVKKRMKYRWNENKISQLP